MKCMVTCNEMFFTIVNYQVIYKKTEYHTFDIPE